MSNNEMQELSDKLRRGLQLAEKRLLEKMLVTAHSLVRGHRMEKLFMCQQPNCWNVCRKKKKNH